jgi:hypothetical protein
MGVQHECHKWNPRQGGHGDQKRHCHGLKGPWPKVSRSGVRNAQQLTPCRALNDVIKYTTKALLGIATQHATMEEATKPPPILGSRGAVPSSSKAAPSGITIQGIKGSKKRQKRRPQWVIVVANYNDDDGKKTDGSDMEYVMTIGRSVKCQAWPPKDHFEGLLEEAFPNQAYLIKHSSRITT